MAAGLMGGMAGSDRQENTEPTRHSPKQSGDSAPYWGDLPTGEDGGVYNTVAGHGSAVDDHDQHHYMPPKSASSETSVIPGHIANYLRGGVYNTVTGHGSQEDQSRPYNQSGGIDDNTTTDTAIPATRGPIDNSMIAAPLPDIPEERQKTSRHATFADEPTNAPGLLAGTTVRDDVRLGKAASREGSYTDSAPNPDPVTSQREFPLTTAPAGSRNDQGDSASKSKYGAPAAAVAALGAGTAASGYAGKRKEESTPADQNQTYSRSPDLGNNSQVAGGVVTGKRRSPGQGSPMENTRSSVDNTRSREEESPKGEKRHSKILGIFLRNRDDNKEDTTKARRNSVNERYTAPAKEDVAAVNPNRLRKQSKSEAPMERKRLSSSAYGDTDERSGHGMEKAAAGAAAGAGAFGLVHHKKDSVSEKPQNTTSLTRPMTADSGGAGPARDVPHQVEGVSTPFERPREPPMLPQQANTQAAGAAGQPSTYSAPARGTSSDLSHGAESGPRNTTTSEPGKYNMLAAGAASGVAAAAAGASARHHMKTEDSGEYNTLDSSTTTDRGGVSSRDFGSYTTLGSSGAPDASTTRRDVVASNAGDYNLLKSSGTPPTSERAREGSSGVVTQDPGHYNMLAGGIPSGIKSDSGNSTSRSADRSGNVTQEPGHYNMLASGIPSGVKQESADRGDTKTNAETSDGEPEYNVLQSGTPSGVKYKPKSPRQSGHGSDPATQPDNQARQGQSSMLYPGTAAGTGQGQGPADITTRGQGLRDLPLPPQAAKSRGLNNDQPGHTFFAAPIPSHVRTSHPNPSQESVPGVTTYSHPEAAHNMSPEVMPDAYAAAAPGHTHGQNQSYGQSESQGQYDYPPTQEIAKGMSPAVMPAAYLASAPGHSHSHNQSQTQGYDQSQTQYDYPPTQQTAKGMSPAVMPAAYTESAPRTTTSQSQAQQDDMGSGSMYPQQQHATTSSTTDRGFNPAAPALAAATTSWAASGAGKQGSAGQAGVGSGTGVGASGSRQAQGGVRKVMHRCKHCGEEDDIGGDVERVVREMRGGWMD
jgi:hypothetical protein